MSDEEIDPFENLARMEAIMAPLLRERTPSAPNVNVNIKQQPLDAADAARLYGEILEKAKKELIKTVRVDNCAVDCVVHQALDAMSWDVRLTAIVKINERRLVATVAIDKRKFDSDFAKAFIALRDELAKVVAHELLTPGFSQMLRESSR